MPTASIPPPLKFRRKLLFSVIVTGFSLFLAVLVLEVGGRFVFRRHADFARFYIELQKRVLRSSPILEVDREPGAFDTKFGYVLSPNASSTQTCPEFNVTYSTNALGFRTHELAPRAPGEYRVMMIGDSFFFGTGLQPDETIGEQLEQIARKDPACKRPLKVYNFARPGYCTVQELVVLRTYAAKVAPDYVILGFFAANDMIANTLTRIDEKGNFSTDPAMIAKYRNDLTSNLGLARFSLIGRIVALSPFSTGRLFYQLANRPDYLEPNERWLTTFRDDCRAAGYRYGVVFQHSKDTLIDGWRNYFYSGRELTRKLDAVCDREAVPHVEMLDVLRDGRPWQDYLYMGDAHPKPRGARKTAEAVYETLLKETLHRPRTRETTADAGR
jgi:hypothetical protein